MLTPVEHLVRASMALRGIRPSLADIVAVEHDPGALPGLVDGYLDSPRFGETLRDLHNEAFLAMPDYFYYPAGFQPIGAIADEDLYAINRSVMEAPLRLIEHVIMNDRPYSEIVTADYTLADGIVATVWGLPYAGDGTTWEETTWTDGRQNAGVLSDSWLYQRHRSTESNANRGRANAISNALLCHDFLSLDINVDIDIDLSNPEAVANAVLENPNCAACHETLDPLASYFRGFFPAFLPMEMGEGYPMQYAYVEDLFPTYLGVPMQPPAYFGQPGDGLATLGGFIAEDPRFVACTVRRFYGYLHQVGTFEIPDDAFASLQASFVDSGLDAKSLAKAIVLSDAFRVSHVVPIDGAAPTDAELSAAKFGVLEARPVQLSQLFEDLTGFRWTTPLNGLDDQQGGTIDLGEIDLMLDSFLGYGVLAGGIDSMYVTQPAHTYGGTASLVLQTLAHEAAHAVVEHDFATGPADRKLLGEVEVIDADETAIRNQLALLHLRLYGQRIDPAHPDIDEAWDLFAAALDHSGDVRRAWKTTLAAMLQHVRIAHY
jgi:hypothetical protein